MDAPATYYSEAERSLLISKSTEVNEVMLIDVLLLCTECQQPIKARINTTQWIRAEWIGPSGECRECYQAKRAQGKEGES